MDKKMKDLIELLQDQAGGNLEVLTSGFNDGQVIFVNVATGAMYRATITLKED